MPTDNNFREVGASRRRSGAIFPGVFIFGVLAGLFIATTVDALSIRPSPPIFRSPLAADQRRDAGAGTLLTIDRNITSELRRS